jgi:hypothetical protein
MSDVAESLLEVDRIDEVLEAADPPQPVVVIQYASKSRARFWILALMILISLGAGLAYHRLVVIQLQAQAHAVRRDLESWKERFHIESARAEILPDVKDVTPSTPQPAVPAPVDPESTRAKIATTPDSVAQKESPVEVGKDRDRSPAPAPSPTVIGSAAATTSPAQVPGSPVEPTLQESDDPAPRSHEAVALGPPGIAQPSTTTTSPRSDLPDALAASPVKGSESSPVPSAAPPGTPVAVSPEPPLPSREETLRMIEAEAVQKQEEIRQQVEDKAVEVHRLRYEERVRFHEELRKALELHGQNAGEAIDQLCKRFGYESDSRRIMIGHNYWFMSIKPFGYRAARIRKELDLPETAILNFISDGLNERLRARGGPRDGNEVRVRAAILLLNKCEIPSFEEAGRPTAINSGGAPGTTRQTGMPSSKSSTAARGR